MFEVDVRCLISNVESGSTRRGESMTRAYVNALGSRRGDRSTLSYIRRLLAIYRSWAFGVGRWALSVSHVCSRVKSSFTGIILEELTDFLKERGAAAYRAKQITNWIYKKHVTSFDAMTDLPNELRANLAAEFDTPKTEVVRVLGSKDTTQKFLFRLRDQNLIESVLIPASPALYGQPSDRRTICVSSQVGCAYGCKFCASGLDGFTRNLDVA